MPGESTGPAGTETGDSWPPRAFSRAMLLAIAFVVFWAAELGHEAAHFTVGRLTHVAVHLPNGLRHRRAQVATWGAGPLFTLVVLGVSAVFAARSVSARATTVALAFACSAASRTVAIAPGTLMDGASDERTVGALLGVSPQSLWMAELLFAVACLTVIVRRVPVRVRRPTLAWIGIGVVVGLISALTLGRAIGIPI